MTTAKKKSTRAREIFMRKGNPAVHMSATSVAAAKQLERAGFEYIFIGGDATLSYMLGVPGSYLELADRLWVAKFFNEAVDLPVLVDCDHLAPLGAIHAAKAAEELIKLGIAGMDLDDRVLPTGADQGPKPGSGGLVREHVVDLGILPKQNMVDKIKAIVEVRNALDPDFVVRARCYALDSNIPIPEAVDAMKAYRDAGADVIYIGYPPRDVEQIRQMVKEIDAPCTCPAYFLSYDQAADIGLCEVRHPYSHLFAMYSAGWDFLMDFRQRGVQAIADFTEKNKDNPYSGVNR